MKPETSRFWERLILGICGAVAIWWELIIFIHFWWVILPAVALALLVLFARGQLSVPNHSR